MALELTAIAYEVADVEAVTAFWADLLGRTASPAGASTLLRGTDTQVGLQFVTAQAPTAASDYLHLHLTSTSVDDYRATVARVLALGGRHLDVGQAPDADYTVMADPAGNAFCVNEPDNKYLAGCGFFGEVTCDGTRDVGLFWRDALGWPLVWDRDGETAVQSPLGGTKVSWGGESVSPEVEQHRQWFVLASDDPATEAQRLIELGARELRRRGDVVELADTDGNPFLVEPTAAVGWR